MRITIDIDGASDATAVTTAAAPVVSSAPSTAAWTGIDGGPAPTGATLRSGDNASPSGDAYAGDATNAGAAPPSP